MFGGMHRTRLDIIYTAISLARMAPPTPEADAALAIAERWAQGRELAAEPHHRRCRKELVEASALAPDYNGGSHRAAKAAIQVALYLDSSSSDGDAHAMSELGTIPDFVAAAFASRLPGEQFNRRKAARAGAYRLCAELADLLPALARGQLLLEHCWAKGRSLPRGWCAEAAIVDGMPAPRTAA
jgi:hypothetical protein